MKRLWLVLSVVLTAGVVLGRAGFEIPSTPRKAAPMAVPAPATSEPRFEPAMPLPAATPVASTAPAVVRPAPKELAPLFESGVFLAFLDCKLKLTDLQKAHAEAILRERNRKVEDYGREVAERGWAQLKDFDFRIGVIREEALRRLLMILDSAQAKEFGLQVASGGLDDHLAIEIPDGLVVLD